MLLNSSADLELGGQTVGFPAVLKPISGAASLGVKRVNSQQELTEGYAEIMEELGGLVVSSGALVKNDGSGNGVAASNTMDCSLLLEQYLDGCEVDVDIVMSDGDWRYAAVTDNGPTLEPYFNETWAVCPSMMPSAQQKELKELAIGAVKCLGFRDGIFHVECKYTSHGVQLIEVNARMGGGQVRETNLRVWGVDLVEETLFSVVGIPSRPHIPGKKPCGGAVAYCDLNAEKSGILQNLDFLKPLQGMAGVVWARPYVSAGDSVTGPADGLPTWLVEVVVQKPTSQEAREFLFELQSGMKPLII
jgi:carnosine synthase